MKTVDDRGSCRQERREYKSHDKYRLIKFRKERSNRNEQTRK